jgi:membrane-associated protease RseP (regulator of RpoE activity)
MKRLGITALLAVAILVGVSTAVVAWAMNGGSSSTASADPAQTASGQKVWLGVQISVTPDGPTIAAVISGSPAEKAGLQRGDVIKAVDGTSVSDVAGVRSDLANKNPGDTVKLSITRNGNAQDITVTLEAPPTPLPSNFSNVLPELSGIPVDQLFSHLLSGSLQFKDNSGNTHTATADLGTVTAVDTSANTITVDLNAGGSKTYTITGDVKSFPADLSKFESGDNVAAISVDGNLRFVVATPGRLLGFLGEGKLGGAFHGRFDGGFGMGMMGKERGGGGF